MQEDVSMVKSEGHLALDRGEPTTVAAWEAGAAAVLRKMGRLTEDEADTAVWQRLARTTLDGIVVSPLGTPALVEGLTTSGRPSRAGGWDVRPAFADPDAEATGQAALTDLENGATSVWLALGEHGVPVEDLRTALQHVLLDVAPVVLDTTAPLAAGEALLALADERGVRLHPDTNLGVDPLGEAMRSGADVVAAEQFLPTVDLAIGAGVRGVVVDATTVHDLGGSDAQELGYALAVGASYLRRLVAAGHDAGTAAGLVEFRFAATDEQFPTIAKLRAARRAWARMLELSGVAADERTMRIHAVTSRPMMSKYDPWVNMLRTCVATFAAGVGGADAITVLPFDAPLGLPDAFSRRIARNTSALLVSESCVAAVADPAGGSFLVERLTDDLALVAWEELGRLDEEGGVEAALPALCERIATVATERDRRVATRKLPITGLSEFPNLHEALPERAPYPEGGPAVRRFGHAFEELRGRPAEQRVFLATMGTVAAHTARASFATNLFAAGGVDVVNEGAHDDVDAVLTHYSGEAVVCLIGADPAYAEWGSALAAALREAGARWVIVAGASPRQARGDATGSATEMFEGADDTCAMGVDALDFLSRTRSKLEDSR